MKLNQKPLLQLGNLTFVGSTPHSPLNQSGAHSAAAGLGLGQAVYRSPAGHLFTCTADSRGNVAGHEPIGPRQIWRSVRDDGNVCFQNPNVGQPLVMTADVGQGHVVFVGFWFNIAEIICAQEQAPAMAVLALSHPAAALELARFVTDTAVTYTTNDTLHKLFDLEKFAEGIDRMRQLVMTLTPAG